MEISDQSIAYVWQYPPTLRRNDLCQVFIFLPGGGRGDSYTQAKCSRAFSQYKITCEVDKLITEYLQQQLLGHHVLFKSLPSFQALCSCSVLKLLLSHRLQIV